MRFPGRAALQIFEALAAAPESERAARLVRLCDGNATLRAEVERLLRFDLPDLAEDPPTSSEGREIAELPARTRLGTFEILGVLGRGAHGIVYRARQDHPPREVALKVLTVADDLSARRRFATEIAAQARLNHPAIAQVYEAGVVDGPHGVVSFVAMELVAEAVSLLAHVRARNPDLRARLELLAQIADALDHAHQRGVLHRDLKPDNVLVVTGDGRVVPKLLDFGVAHARDAGGLAPGFAGTPAYCAPERARGDGVAWDVRSDVYSLGVVACEVLTGQLPIDVRGDDAVTALARVATEVGRSPGALDRRLRGDVDAVVGKALARQPEHRYASAREFAADLRRHLRREPVSARGGGAAYRLSRFVVRHPARTAGVIVLLAVLAYAARARIHRDSQTRWALGVVSTVLATAIDGMDRLPGTARARGACLDRLLDLIEPVANALPEDGQVLGVYADLLRRRGHVERDLGQWEAASSWRRRGLSVRETLATLDPRPSVASDLAEDIVLLGDVYQDTGAFAEARSCYERAHAVFETQAAAYPDSRRCLDDLGCSCDRLVGVWNALDPRRTDVIGRLLDLREQINESLRRLAPDHQATLLGRNEYHGLRARYAHAQGDMEQALHHHREHLATARELLARYGGEKLASIRATDAAYQLADFLLSREGPVPALAVLDEMRTVAVALRDGDDPGRWVAWAFVLTEGRVALAENRIDACERLVRSVVDHIAERPSPSTAWLGGRAKALLDEVERARR